MSAALPAHNFGPAHEVAVVRRGTDISISERLIETGPARAGFEFRIGAKQRCAATDAAVHPSFVVVPILARERRFGTLFAGDVVLLWRHHFFPFRVGARSAGVR